MTFYFHFCEKIITGPSSDEIYYQIKRQFGKQDSFNNFFFKFPYRPTFNFSKGKFFKYNYCISCDEDPKFLKPHSSWQNTKVDKKFVEYKAFVLYTIQDKIWF